MGAVPLPTKVVKVTVRSGWKGSWDHVHTTSATVRSGVVAELVSRIGEERVGFPDVHRGSPYAPTSVFFRAICIAASVAPSAAYAVERCSRSCELDNTLALASDSITPITRPKNIRNARARISAWPFSSRALMRFSS